MKAITRSRWLILMVLLGSAYLPLQVSAETAARQATSTMRAGEIFGSAAVDSQELAISRGGAEVVINDLKNKGIVSDNKANHVITGSNWVGEGSFAGATGFATVLQNSGNNVLIQNATIINLQVK